MKSYIIITYVNNVVVYEKHFSNVAKSFTSEGIVKNEADGNVYNVLKS